LSLLDLLFPPRCAGCHAYGSPWCSACQASLEPIPTAEVAGVPLVAGGRFAGPLKLAIHTYKYGGRKALARELTRPLLLAIGQSGLQPQALAFVPLHAERERQRGFNQAQQIALELGKALGVPVIDGLRRVRPTPAQVGLSQVERQENVVGAFNWAGGRPAPRQLAVVDDVCTTGATLQAAAEAIREAGGSLTAFLVLARAQTFTPAAVTSRGQPACP
jgi:ComF family protein